MRAHLVSGVSTTIPDQIGIQISWFFKERRKPRYLLKKKKLSQQRRELPTISALHHQGFKPGLHWWQASCSRHLVTLALPLT